MRNRALHELQFEKKSYKDNFITLKFPALKVLTYLNQFFYVTKQFSAARQYPFYEFCLRMSNARVFFFHAGL